MLTTAQVANVTGLSTRTLEGYRANNDPDGPPFVRLPNGRPAYPSHALADWMTSQPRFKPLLTLAEQTLLAQPQG